MINYPKAGDNIGSILGSQGYNTIKVSRIDLATGEVVEKQSSSSASYGTQEILLVGFSPDGSTADISVSRNDNPGLFSFEF